VAAGAVKARRSTDSNMAITEKQYTRVHPNPRRFLVCSTTDWESTICYENQHMLLINKPAATPSHSTVDNIHENVSACVQASRPNDDIQAAHRLDVAISGFIMLSKHAAFVAAFMLLQARVRESVWQRGILHFKLVQYVMIAQVSCRVC
jgi:23S rRNA-/tRNA-specific pseudouridylate synthase